MRARDVMQYPAVVVESRAPVLYAIGLLDQSGYAQLPVVQDGELLGTFVAADVRHLYWEVAEKEGEIDLRVELARRSVGQVCSPPLPVVEPDRSLSGLLRLLDEHHAVLVACDEGYGIVTSMDLVVQVRPAIILDELEDELRAFLTRELARTGPDWWERRVPTPVRKRCESRRQDELAGLPAALAQVEQETPLLEYASFGDYLAIILEDRNWQELFQPIFRSKEWVMRRFTDLRELRNRVAHNRKLDPDRCELLDVYAGEFLAAIRGEPLR
ncbi:CBS domain-containing protein [Limnochorda pilosa]|uniref:CBS domain-containing protein n=1 Tax=Limnochorda pilosa TaxID=1555112 RepID=UPI0026EE507B|nr:CBS domain-containing protein [Limnochorda pilosa]